MDGGFHEVLIVVRGFHANIGCIYFDVAENGRLHRVSLELEVEQMSLSSGADS